MIQEPSFAEPFDLADLRTPEGVSYQSGGRGNGLWARFDVGKRVPVVRARVRSYPGVASEAPATYSFYRRAIPLFEGARRVLDAGCGAGQGARLLSRHFAEVIAVDSDAEAVEFARQLAKDATVRCADLASWTDPVGYDAALAVDLLAHVGNPVAVLGSIRRALAPSGKLIVAEQVASPIQYLRHPMRRAFSKQSLGSLLTLAGFEVEKWLVGQGTFLSCSAVPSADPAWIRLAEGAELVAKGAAEAAAVAYRSACNSTSSALRLEATLALGDLHFALRQGDPAVFAYMEARAIDPLDARAFAALSRIALLLGQIDDAADFAQSARRIDPTDLGSACASALVSDKTTRGLSHGQWFTASNLAPDDLAIAMRLAESSSERGDHALGVWALERVSGYGDDHGALIHLATASALLRAERRADALLQARLARARNPEDPATTELLALLDSSEPRASSSNV